MNKTNLFFIYLSVFIIISINSISAQNIIRLPLLSIKDKVETPLANINEYLGNKKNGKSFPICKIVFSSEDNNQLKFYVEAIDNSWTNLFRYDEVTYGYVIVNNRMFVIMSPKIDIVDLNSMFDRTTQFKTFDKSQKPPSWKSEIPKWYYELKDNDYQLISTQNLEVLE